jgi:hypothetical protein
MGCNITLDVRDTVLVGMDWMEVVENWVQFGAVVNTVISIPLP